MNTYVQFQMYPRDEGVKLSSLYLLPIRKHFEFVCFFQKHCLKDITQIHLQNIISKKQLIIEYILLQIQLKPNRRIHVQPP